MAGAFCSYGSFSCGGGVLATSAGRLGGDPPRFASVWFAGGGVCGTLAGVVRSLTAEGGPPRFASVWLAGGGVCGTLAGIVRSLTVGGRGTFPELVGEVRAIFSFGRTVSFGRVFAGGGTFLAAVAGWPGRFATGACCTICGLAAATGGRVGAPPAAMARGVGLISGCGITWARASCCGLTFTMLRATGSEPRNVLALTAVVATVW